MIPDKEVDIEHYIPDQPHSGKVLAVVQAHADDLPLFGAGTVAKLIKEGYAAYLIQTTNDEKCGPGPGLGENILQNQNEVDDLVNVLGLKDVYHLGYRNHRLDESSPLELRSRLIFLFRALKVDTVMTFNPWGTGEENPDHYVTAKAVEAARWMAGMAQDYSEHMAAGVMPHTVKDQYYWTVRYTQTYNRVVDIEPFLDEKIAAMRVNRAQGPAGSAGSRLRARLANEGTRLPVLGEDEETADKAYIRLFGLDDFTDVGRRHGLACAEAFYYVPAGGTFIGTVDQNKIQKYIDDHAESL